MEGSRRRCESYVRTLGGVDRADGIERVYRLRRGISLPAREHYIVAAPFGAVEKSRRGFATWWEELEHQQLDLLAAAA
jgi:hypothetical protein